MTPPERASRPRAAFVASGGGGKGLAHLGVLRACEEAGIDFNVYVGTSAGAMACACRAAGLTAEELVAPFGSAKSARRWGEFRSPLPIFARPNLELLTRAFFRTRGVLRADGIEHFLRRSLPTDNFGELESELHVVATDLASSDRFVFNAQSGVPVSSSVAASMALPVVFRPFRVAGREYVDGAISRSLSLDVACASGPDLVVASMVHSPHQARDGVFPHRGMLRIVTQAINTMARSRGLMEVELCRHEHPDVEVVLVESERRDLSLVNAFSPREAWEVIVGGYASGRRALRDAGLLT